MKLLNMPGLWILALVLNVTTTQAQEQSSVNQLIQVPTGLFSKINVKIRKLNQQLSNQTEKFLQKLARREERLKRRLSKIDSAAVKDLFDNSGKQYSELLAKLKSNVAISSELSGEYLPYADSLKTMLSFIDRNEAGLPKSLQGKSKNVLNRFTQLQDRFKGAEKAREFISQRKLQIKDALSRYIGLSKNLTSEITAFNKEIYYYGQQIREYKEIMNDPDKLTRKALSLVNKLPAFQDFMKQHSQLAGLFWLPAGYDNLANTGGLQTRSQVQSLIQGQLSAVGPNSSQALQQNVQAAQAQLNQFKDKLSRVSSAGGDMEMPDFKPNNQRTKNFLQRLEIGTNVQNTKSNFFFPTTTDLGLSIGYKLNDKSTIGIGGSYKVGWGKDIRNIVVTSEGAGLRSFLDVKLKGSFYASGGFEYNYQPLDTTGIGRELVWSKSGLLGLSKVLSLKSKFFKKTKLQLLWDFMSYSQMPRTQALKFRLGYSLR